MGREGRMARAPEGQAKAVTRDPSLDVLKQSGKLLDAMDAAISSEAAMWSKLLYGTVVYRVNYTDETVEVVPYPEWPEQMRGRRVTP